jgi:hypothetical protein
MRSNARFAIENRGRMGHMSRIGFSLVFFAVLMEFVGEEWYPRSGVFAGQDVEEVSAEKEPGYTGTRS